MKTLTALLSVLFMPDQLRYDSLGCTGNPVIRTPHFDSLAQEGTLFTSECLLQQQAKEFEQTFALSRATLNGRLLFTSISLHPISLLDVHRTILAHICSSFPGSPFEALGRKHVQVAQK
jgi:hypothetical protein